MAVYRHVDGPRAQQPHHSFGPLEERGVLMQEGGPVTLRAGARHLVRDQAERLRIPDHADLLPDGFRRQHPRAESRTDREEISFDPGTAQRLVNCDQAGSEFERQAQQRPLEVALVAADQHDFRRPLQHALAIDEPDSRAQFIRGHDTGVIEFGQQFRLPRDEIVADGCPLGIAPVGKRTPQVLADRAAPQSEEPIAQEEQRLRAGIAQPQAQRFGQRCCCVQVQVQVAEFQPYSGFSRFQRL